MYIDKLKDGGKKAVQNIISYAFLKAHGISSLQNM